MRLSEFWGVKYPGPGRPFPVPGTQSVINCRVCIVFSSISGLLYKRKIMGTYPYGPVNRTEQYEGIYQLQYQGLWNGFPAAG